MFQCMRTSQAQANVAFIFITVMLDMIGIGVIIPSMPDIMRRFQLSESAIPTYLGYFIATYATMQFVASPLLGLLSDRYGRRPVLLLSLFVAAFDYLLMGFAPTLTVLFFGRALAGLTGANVTVAMAYIADVSNDKNRAANFGKMGAAFGLGFIIGPILGGLAAHKSAQLPFILAAVLNLLNFVFGLFVLPESLKQRRVHPITLQDLNPLNSIKNIFNIPNILLLSCVYFLISLAGQTHPSVWNIYTQTRYQWNPAQVGFSLTFVGLLAALVQIFITNRAVKTFGELPILTWGTFAWSITFLMFGLASEGWMIYAILIPASVTSVMQPALQSLLAGRVHSNLQGQLQGSLVSLQSLASIINPLITTQLFAIYSQPNHTPYAPGAPYFFASAVTAFNGLLVLIYKTKAAKIRRLKN